MKPIRGTYDLYDQEMAIHNLVIEELKKIVKRYSFTQIKTPIFEETELFKRSTGNSSDIVQKEMYEFEDKGGRSITLRPELTAGAIRAFLTNKIYGKRQTQYKYFYYGEAFRYERPQSGRFRQFYQFGVEMLQEKSVYADVEIISLANNIIKHFGLEQKVTLKVNTIGSSKERKLYTEILQNYFAKYKDELCEDCLTRLELNPLRILDCKIDANKEIIQNAPKLKEVLEDITLKKYAHILTILDDLNIDYEEDATLVRGLDYYNDIVFEFVYQDEEEEYTIIGGGRYDGLINQLANQDVPAIGFGIGVERLIYASKKTTPEIFADVVDEVEIFYMPQTEKAMPIVLKSMDNLRQYGFLCETSYTIRSLKSLYKEAESKRAIYAVVITEENLENNLVKIKNLVTKEEDEVALKDFEEDLIIEAKKH